MKAVEIDVLLHYYVFPEAHPRMSIPSVQEAIHALKGHYGLLMDGDVTNITNIFDVTDKGVVFIKMLLETPLPEQVWADPRKH